MGIYSDYEQRQLDQESGAQLDRMARRSEEIRERIQAYAIATLFVGVLVAWGWACIVGVNS